MLSHSDRNAKLDIFPGVRHNYLFPEILLQEERVVLNLFDDVSVTANREQFTEEAEQYTWSGSVPDKLSFITLSIHKPSLSVTGRIWVDGLGQYSIHSHSD
ncbi:hypothetical protein CSA57_05590 [candidate division KSB3 bacterium]|nr:MAG: hypothetical protein CSA57_05590 [candidate division KSB3 bacterium]